MPEANAHAARRPHPVLAILGRGLESVLNRLLALDPETAARVAALEGRALTVDLRHGLPPLRLVVAAGRLGVGPDDAPSALRVSATPASLLALALARGREGTLPDGRVEIAGDAALARQLAQLATRFAPDIEEAFTRILGDVAGVALARALRAGLAGAGAAVRGLARDSAEFLTEESRDLVARAEFEAFGDEVQALAARAGRLQVRLGRLAGHAGMPGA
ncbi:ubiquinone biosynthesis accessory factor UbiJ [Dokdonella sp.]|uniref:ubiquinone biosynthesis accessory factor UbiJ n=1 Tax=Dokdonella sp. TaxID=2291710 RepID=UPI0031CA146C|nr:SCP2 sterol-binding domain-containing protein [Dokdonella sp.]